MPLGAPVPVPSLAAVGQGRVAIRMSSPERSAEWLARARWYVVHAHPARETVAVVNLERQGFRAYLPQVARTVRHARQVRHVMRPLFPRYLFVRLNVEMDRWRAVQSTYGVSALIMEGERPRAAPGDLVEGLMAAADGAGGFDFRGQLVRGGQVRFLKGPFADRLGRVVEMSDAERVRVLLEILGTEREVEADSGNLFPATD